MGTNVAVKYMSLLISILMSWCVGVRAEDRIYPRQDATYLL